MVKIRGVMDDYSGTKVRKGTRQQLQAEKPPVSKNNSSANLLPQTLLQPKRTRTFSSDTDTYGLEKFTKNAMIIFDHENFLAERKRLGTHLDVEALEETFTGYRFQVTTHNDLTRKEVFRELEKFGKRDFSDYGCICVAILTHGQDHGFLRAYDTRYSERDAFACFDARANPSLAGKPIIFLIQACRGRNPAQGIEPQDRGSAQNIELDADTRENSYCRPTESDMIIFHSSFFGRASVRVVDEGTWFIQTLCEQIKLHAGTDHLEDLFRRVRTKVAVNKEFQGAKQMPVVTSTLLRKLYLIEGRADSTSVPDAFHIRRIILLGNVFECFERCLTFTLHMFATTLREIFELLVRGHPSSTSH